MKRNISFISIGAALLLVLFTSSCGQLEIPESVSVKTNARFQAPMGTAKYDVTKKLGPDSIRSKIQDALGDKATVYTYAENSSDDTLRYLIHFPAFNVPVDISSYLDEMEFEANFDALNKTVSFKAGDKITASQPISYNVKDITDQLTDEAEFTVPMEDATLYEGTTEFNSDQLPQVTVENGTDDLSFDRIYYSAGSVQVKFEKKDSNTFSSGYKLEMIAYLVPADFTPGTDNPDEAFITKSGWQDITKNDTLVIPLNVASGLPKDFQFVFKERGSGGNNSVQHKYKPSASYQGIKVRKVEGLNSTNGLDLGDKEIPVDLSSAPEGFNELTFDEATVNAKVNKPSGWSGVQIDFTQLKFTGPSSVLKSGSSITQTSSDYSNYLINKTYTAAATIYPQGSGSVSVLAQPKLTLNNATIDFGSDGNSNQSISGNVSFSLNKIKQAKVNLETLGITGVTLPTNGEEGSVELPGELLKFVNQINFREYKSDTSGNPTSTPSQGFGLKCKVTNTLPAGNDISFNIQILKNGSYGYDQTATIPAGSNNSVVDWAQKDCILKFPAYQEGVTKYLDFSAQIAGAEDFALNNLELGKSYSFGLQVMDFAYDWDSVSLNLDSVRYNSSADLPFDITSLMENLPNMENEINKIKIKQFPFYLYAKNSAVSGIASGLNGKLYISYEQNGLTKYKNLQTGNTTPPNTYANEEIAFVNFDLPLPSNKAALLVGNTANPNNIAYYFEENRPSVSTDLKEILDLVNASNVKLNYDIGLKDASNTTVYKASLDAVQSGEPTNISVDLVTILSFDFGLTAPISLNVMKVTNEDYDNLDENGKYSDILKRSEISTFDKYEKYMEYIDSVGIKYQLVNKLFKNLELSVDIDDRHGPTLEHPLINPDDYSGLHKDLNIDSGGTVLFEQEDIENIMTKIFHPNVTINLGRALDTAAGESALTGYLTNPSELTVSRSGLEDKDALSANIILFVQMDGDHPISLWGGQE